jgi:glycosyl transferase family 25
MKELPSTTPATISGEWEPFQEARIINLADRLDRRKEMKRQNAMLSKFAAKVYFYDAVRPTSAQNFPSIGARGCFESHLHVLRQACSDELDSILVVEDDFDFRRAGRAADVIKRLAETDWDLFYGAHLLRPEHAGLVAPVAPDCPVITASFVGFRGRVLPEIVHFMEEMLKRPAGSPAYGPMHVDGAYSVFRMLHPEFRTVAAFPPLGRQRRSRSDITPSGFALDRWPLTRSLTQLARRACNSFGRR